MPAHPSPDPHTVAGRRATLRKAVQTYLNRMNPSVVTTAVPPLRPVPPLGRDAGAPVTVAVAHVAHAHVQVVCSTCRKAMPVDQVQQWHVGTRNARLCVCDTCCPAPGGRCRKKL